MNFEIVKSSLGSVSYRKIGKGKRKILFFHGFPGSSQQIQIFKSEIDIEVLCFDRPGYNQTEIKTTDSLKACLSIAEELVSKYNWSEFEIVTVSGGTPFGINYALKHPNKVKGLRIICGLGNLVLPKVRACFSTFSLFALRQLPRIPGWFLKKAFSGSRTSGRNFLISFFLPASLPDVNIFQRPEVAESLNRALLEAFLQKGLGPQQDALVFLKNWSVGATDLEIPVHFWHGDQDQVISWKVSEAMSALFPNSKFNLVKNQGHISLPVEKISNILKSEMSS